MKKILWIHTGGTIACKKSADGLSPMKGEEFFSIAEKLIPEDVFADKRLLFNIDSTDITPSHWKELARTIFGSLNYDGFVITHGTDTMQYSSAALALMLENFNKPVIFTGSQKPFGEANSDAYTNLSSAFAAARDLPCGVFVVFAGKIISGLSALKTSSRDIDCFTDAYGIKGEVNPNKAVLFNPICANDSKPALRDKLCEKVFLLKITPCINENIIDFIIDNGYKGIVCEAYGLGGIPGDFLSGINRLTKLGIRVLITSQCPFGGADLNIYTAHAKAVTAGAEALSLTSGAALIKLMIELGESE